MQDSDKGELIASLDYIARLRNDLHKLSHWHEDLLMIFNVDICKVTTVTITYHIDNTVLPNNNIICTFWGLNKF